MDVSEEEKSERVRHLREVVGDDLDEETCAALLADNHWNVEATARMFFEGPNSPRVEPQPRSADDFARNIFSQFEAETNEEVDSPRGTDGIPTHFAAAEEVGGMRARRGGRGVSPERENLLPHRAGRSSLPPIPQKSFAVLLKEAFTGQSQFESPAAAARRFASEFEKLVGSERQQPAFFESSFEDALLSASTDRKTLVAYLHSSLHPDSEAFCRDVLCSRPVLNALADQRVWGGSVLQPDGYLASNKLLVAGCPCLVIIATDRGRDARIVDRIYSDDMHEASFAERVAAKLQAARSIRPSAPTISPAQQREMDERRRVVEEQDAALRQAMDEDRRREEEKRARERQAEEEKQRQEQEARMKQEALQNKRQKLRAEPAAGPNTATIRFQFPGGSKVNRRFDESDTINYVREYLDIYLADNLKTPDLRYALILSYPKRVLEDNSQTLKDAGLVPQAVLLLQDLDA